MMQNIVLITRKTRLEGLVERFNTRPQARFYIERNGGDFEGYEREHETYRATVAQLGEALAALGRVQPVERTFLPNFIFAAGDVVVTIGVDGQVVNTAKYLNGQPLVAVNPAPQAIDGVLLPFTVLTAPAAVAAVLRHEHRAREISMAQARLNDGQMLLAFNDLFIGARSHVSARYALRHAGRSERHSSSGVIVSTGAGMTGWVSSLFNMTNGLLAYSGQPACVAAPTQAWHDERLLFVVREPFASKSSQAGLVCGAVTPDQPLQIESHMPEGGVIFSDGVESDFLAFNSGATATITLAARKTLLVVP
jgi:hypothetical protein